MHRFFASLRVVAYFLAALALPAFGQAPVTTTQIFDYSAVTLDRLQNTDGTIATVTNGGFVLSATMRVVPGATLTWHSAIQDGGPIGLFFGTGGPYYTVEYFQDSAATQFVSFDPSTTYNAQNATIVVPSTSTIHFARIQMESGSTSSASNLSGSTLTTNTPYVLPAPMLALGVISNHLNTDPPFTVLATSNSSEAITYSITSGPATISGNTVTLTGVGGSVLVQASQAATDSYAAATSTQSFVVTGPLSGSAFTSITHVNITDGSGNQLVSGKECFTPVNNNGVPITASFSAGGVTGTIRKTPTCGRVAYGALQPGFQLVKSSVTSPLNLCYQMTLTNSTTGQVIIGPGDGYGCIQPTSSSLELSTVAPNLPGLTVQVTGPQGPQGLPGASGGSSLIGKKVMFWGDSLSSIFSSEWQNAFIARTGAVYYSQDARPGRTWGSALEGYGASCPLSSISALGTYSGATSVSTSSQCGFSVGGLLSDYNTFGTTPPVNGNTLAQTLANVDALIVPLGTNDASLYAGKFGNLGDAYTATEAGAIAFALDAWIAAKPTLRIILVTPTYFSNGCTTSGASSGTGASSTLLCTPSSATNSAAAEIGAEVNIIVASGQSRGIPVLNMLQNGGIGPTTLGTFTRDGTHPTDYHFTNIYGPAIAQFTIQWF